MSVVDIYSPGDDAGSLNVNGVAVGGGSGLLLKATKQLNNAEIIALPTNNNGIEVVADPGASKLLLPFYATFLATRQSDGGHSLSDVVIAALRSRQEEVPPPERGRWLAHSSR